MVQMKAALYSVKIKRFETQSENNENGKVCVLIRQGDAQEF